MTNDTLLRIPPELLAAKTEEFLDPAFAVRMRDEALNPYYWNEMGEANEFQRILKEKLAGLPRSLLVPGLEQKYREVVAILDCWTMSTMTPDEVKIFLKEWADAYAQTETLSVDDIMTRVAGVCLGLPGRFSDWIIGALDGLRSCAKTIGTRPITIFSGETVPPTIANWLSDYERYGVNHPSSGTIMIAEYLTRSPNVRMLNETERGGLLKLFRWFNILRFGEGPTAVVDERPTDRPMRPTGLLVNASPAPQPPTTRVPQSPPPPTAPPLQTVPPAIRPQRPQPPAAPPPAPIRPEERIRRSLSQGRALIAKIERMERVLPPLDPSSPGKLATLTSEALAGGNEAFRALAGLFQLVRSTGLKPLTTDQGLVRLVRETVSPFLQTNYRLAPEAAQRAVDLPPNRLPVTKEFLRLFLAKTGGNETTAARLMVHLASLVPESLVGPEATFAFYDLATDQYRWTPTEVTEDGIVRSAWR